MAAKRSKGASWALAILALLMVVSGCASTGVSSAPSPSTRPGRDAFPISQEIIYFSTPGGVLSSRTERIPFTEGAAPDEEVRAYLGWTGSPPPGSLVHSTSWHFDRATGELVLTWAVTPDPKPGAAVQPVLDAPIAQGADAAHPVPSGLADQAVITHAARHLAFLMETDPEVDAALALQPDLHAALAAFAPALAGNPVATP
jgi:hypothetical protein